MAKRKSLRQSKEGNKSAEYRGLMANSMWQMEEDRKVWDHWHASVSRSRLLWKRESADEAHRDLSKGGETMSFTVEYDVLWSIHTRT